MIKKNNSLIRPKEIKILLKNKKKLLIKASNPQINKSPKQLKLLELLKKVRTMNIDKEKKPKKKRKVLIKKKFVDKIKK